MNNLSATHNWSVVWWPVESTEPELDFESSDLFSKEQAKQFARNESQKGVVRAVALPTARVSKETIALFAHLPLETFENQSYIG